MFRSLSIGLNVVLFSGAAPLVWFAGSREARYVDGIERITDVGEALIGMLLLYQMR